ncbi:hypothetical protein JI721_03070 [Alicyclobacillus cycloheptanicus]|uniref:Uncharacterized protein n=1 Tax=Alicyclobacillus cycloheptanicus TaxID=1457 RepID=A0ABT9XK07_9BACL|nr:hypothetical protein [Alicyclobacillus cycloheptanicus]MDQ0190645.1 hypothetical protein [Alicyclobacillus cycloheptanicus]WDM01843.1 hypothetical protein JI721_03070 [Alicyclobacillus cycloheptanicus]
MWRYGLTARQYAEQTWRKSWWREYLRLRLVVDQLPPEVIEPREALKRVDHILALACKRGDRSFRRVATGKRLRPAMQAVCDALVEVGYMDLYQAL